MIHLLTVIGARPQIIKAAVFSRAISQHFSDKVQEHILHTGQHYDQNMSQVFFDELGIPQPEYNLGVGSGRHGQQTAKMIDGIEQILLSRHFDGIVLYGDTNSTLAGAVAASKLQIPIFHIEAGLRSFNMSMPEEVNRIVCDQLSSILFAPTQTAVDNLHHERLDERTKVCLSGDIMYDNCQYFAPIADQKVSILSTYNLTHEGYILATIHRDFNTDNPDRLASIFSALQDLAKEYKIVLPLHPRTKSKLDTYGIKLQGVELIPPASFLEMLALEQHARLVLTDSGGVQKEAFFLQRPCVILRPETEWVEIIQHGAGVIADADYAKILDGCKMLSDKAISFPKLFGDGHAAEAILKQIISYLGSRL